MIMGLIGHAQTLKITTIAVLGQQPVAQVKILILDQKGEIITLATTNNIGQLDTKLSYGTYTIKASHLAYEKWSQEVSFSTTNTSLTIPLVNRIEDLNEITINTSGYIRKHGDTTTINLPKVVNGKERNVLDVLKKIKGVRVQDDGTVIYNKKEVTDVLINGTKIFDHDYKSALDKIRPHEMVKIQFIENYKDDTNSKLIARDAMAMNLGFKNKFFISGTVEGGLGIEKGRIIGADLLQNAPWITSFLNIEHQNTGKSESRDLNNNTLSDNISIPLHYDAYSNLESLTASGLEKIKATDFNTTTSSRLNTNIKLSKKTKLFVKNTSMLEELQRTQQIKSSYLIDDIPVIRDEFTKQNVDYFKTETQLTLQHKKERSIFKSSFYHRYIDHDYQQDINLNGNNNKQVSTNKNQEYNLDIKYEKLLSHDNPLLINIGYSHQPLENNLTNLGFNNVNQELHSLNNSFYAHASYLQQTKNNIVKKLYLNNRYTTFTQDQKNTSTPRSIKEQISTSLAGMKWEKKSEHIKWILDPGMYLASLSTRQDYNNVKTRPYVKASLDLEPESKAQHYFSLDSSPEWILQQAYTDYNIYDSYNSTYRIAAVNDLQQKTEFSYRITDYKNNDTNSLSIFAQHYNKSTISNVIVNPNSTENQLEIIEDDHYNLGINIRYNTLFIKKFFLEISSSPTIGNSYFKGSNDLITESKNYYVPIEMKFNRRINKDLFIGSTYHFKYIQFDSSVSSNHIKNYEAQLYTKWTIGDIELKGNYNFVQLGNNDPAHFSSITLNYVPNKSRIRAFLNIYNLFNTESISQTSTSNLGTFFSSYNLPQRRLFASVSYTF